VRARTLVSAARERLLLPHDISERGVSPVDIFPSLILSLMIRSR
jgi:hypothetical protein